MARKTYFDSQSVDLNDKHGRSLDLSLEACANSNMNTPAHLAASLLVWPKENRWLNASAIAFGAVLPDLSMFVFYGYQKSIGSSEQEIWGTLYFQENWQCFFDVLNSIPIAILLYVIFRWLKVRWAQLLVASAGLHMFCDLPLHHDDGHRHFLPLSNWRFESPISYWDPDHFGFFVAAIELGFAVSALVYVIRKGEKPIRRFAMGTLMLYAFAILILVVVLARRF